MTQDHYATLGVVPTSEDVVIRAAYLALMRRYHPDRNPSPEAAARARAITAAYAVIGDWDRRVDYDLQRAQARVAQASASQGRARRRPSPTALFAAGSMALLLLVAMSPKLWLPEQSERLPAAPVRQAAAAKSESAPDPQSDCSSAATRELVKRELFRRAARLRGSDSAPFERLAGHALVRIETPEVVKATAAGRVSCSAWVALDLPPGVAVTGGRRNLNAEIRYSVKSGGGSVTLSNEGQIVTPLATLAQVRTSVEAADQPDVPVAMPAEAPPRIARPAPPAARTIAPTAAPAVAAKPSFSCRFAKGRGETAVCRNADLARLDRHLAVLYGQSWGQGDVAKRAELLGTRDRFLARRDSCRSDSCITEAYVGRMREVSEIMSAK